MNSLTDELPVLRCSDPLRSSRFRAFYLSTLFLETLPDMPDTYNVLKLDHVRSALSRCHACGNLLIRRISSAGIHENIKGASTMVMSRYTFSSAKLTEFHGRFCLSARSLRPGQFYRSSQGQGALLFIQVSPEQS